MEDQDVNQLLHALENETNASIMRLTTTKIKCDIPTAHSTDNVLLSRKGMKKSK